ncbi:choline-sulfatase [Azospirillum fermentarium]|uniref:choline-sulfatase n=1 Tax=Azospirillum fermentarium TaxID=1233114 RepID=UPI0022271A9D|nr:choline-sulfatase [Azospirillum fermentarium]MCW2248861.1 choline-sulfatase [Azospirillum fermentarium]
MTRSPNILFIMADQLAAPALPFYGHPLVKAPHLSRLAADGTVFENAYCAYPLCAPSRFSLLSGRLPSAIGAYDNAAEFASSVPTFVHHARAAGYRTCLSGKMHFVGADQLHGFEERLTTDVYPADFGWTPDWENGVLAYDWSHHMASVIEAGPCHRSLQIDFDEETAHQAVQKIYDYGRTTDDGPFFLTVSFTHPHDPFNCLPEHWDLYDHDAIDPPAVPPIPVDELDPHSRRLHVMDSLHRYDLTDERVRTARHAYYGSVSYVDDLVGRLLTALERAGLADDTIVVFTGDHGEMLGERGMWYKMTFFEWSSRVPLVVRFPPRHAPAGWRPGRVAVPVSHVDLFPTFLALFGERAPPPVDPLDGASLLPLLTGDDPGDRDVFAEYLGEGVLSPAFMVRRGRYKYIVCEDDPPQLFDLATDPHERANRAGDPALADVEAALAAAIARRWDAAALKQAVIDSQRRRLFAHGVLLTGRHTPWDYQPHRTAATAYVRNFGVAEDTLKAVARLPPVAPVPPDFPNA